MATALCTLFSLGLKWRSRSAHILSTMPPLVVLGTIGGFLASFVSFVGVATAVRTTRLDPSGSAAAIFWMASAARLHVSWPRA